MKRVEALSKPIMAMATVIPGKDMHIVHRDGPSVRVHRYVVEDERGMRHVAELSAHEAGVHRCLIDAPTSEDLGTLIEAAAKAFARSIRQRTQTTSRSTRV